MNFKFNLGDDVKIICSDESGVITGRAEYSEAKNQYFLRYKAADGRAVESWWSELAIEKK